MASLGQLSDLRPQSPLSQAPKVAKDFYHKGWRGDSAGQGEEEDQLLHLVSKTASEGMDLRKALQKLLESGADERSVTNAVTGLTKYHTPSVPCSGIHRSCCTSNAPSEDAFARGVDTLRQLLLEAKNMSRQKNHDMIYSSPEDLFRKLLCDIRERLRAVFALSFEDTISLFPSGTDAELMPSLLALLRARRCGADVFSIISCAGEVGSGTELASTGHHFAKLLPSGRKAAECTCQDVFSSGSSDASLGPLPTFAGVALGARDEAGGRLSPAERDCRVVAAVKKAAAERKSDGSPVYGCILVHMVVGSKTGHIMPSAACLQQLANQFGDLVLPVVDACQGRIGSDDIREWLDLGYLVLITGSKFFGGPPFSGVCLMSGSRAHELEQLIHDSQALEMLRRTKLKEYITAALMSDDLPNLRSVLPQRPLNYGVLMRWTVALHSMEQFYCDITAQRRVALMRQWATGVRQLIRDSGGPHIVLLEEEADADLKEGDKDARNEQAVALSTIISFHCYCNRGASSTGVSPMSMEEMRQLQFLMASDLGAHKPQLNLLGVARTRCFLGQPVELNSAKMQGSSGVSRVLRNAASAGLVVRMARESVEAVLVEDSVVFEKLRLVLGCWHMFEDISSNL